MKEVLKSKAARAVTGITLGAMLLEGCTVDSYLTDPTNVKCDGKRTETGLKVGGLATFIVHGKNKGELATVQVRRSTDNMASLRVAYDTASSPPQQIEANGFSVPTPILDGPELSVVAGGGVWIIDARKSTVVIQGSCAGL